MGDKNATDLVTGADFVLYYYYCIFLLEPISSSLCLSLSLSVFLYVL